MSATPIEQNSEFFQSTGRFFQVLGSSLLIVEVIAGIFAIDIAVLICLMKQEAEGKHPGFLYGYLWGRMSSQNRCLVGNDLYSVALGAFVESLIAGVMLSLEFATPVIAIAILGTWFATVSMIAFGKAMEAYGKRLGNDNTKIPSQAFPTFPPGTDYDYNNPYVPSAPAY